jgi:pimeloyl-ACP methyl ester carboxylesterase
MQTRDPRPRFQQQECGMSSLTSIILACVVVTGLAPLAASAASAEPARPTHSAVAKSGRLAINGIDYYYEIRGKGEPLLLLHGGLGSIDMFGPALPKLAGTRRVIAVDLQGHGRTALGDRPFRLESIGDDMAVLVNRLGYDRVDVMGYSLGGGVALRMALQHPERVRRLVLVSTPFSDEGYYPGIHEQQFKITAAAAAAMKDTPMYKSYVAVAPKVEDFPRLLDTLGDFMRQNYDWSAEISGLKVPVMLVYGDSDMFRPEHIVKFYQLLGGGLQDAGWQRETMAKNRLAILPGVTHYDIFLSPQLTTTALPFLDGKSDALSWAQQVKKEK